MSGISVERHYHRMKHPLAQGLVLALVLGAGAACAEPVSYRVAGIFAADGHQPLAVIELSGGTQNVYRAGDQLEDASILDVTPDGVQVQVGDELLFLPLRGDPRPLRGKDQPAPAPNIDPINTEVNYAKAVQQLTAALSGAGKTAGEDTALRPAINRILQLHPEARIVTIDHTPVDSEHDTIERLTEAMSQGAIPRLEVSGVQGVEAVYVIPSPEPSPGEP